MGGTSFQRSMVQYPWLGQARSSHTCWKGLDPPEAGALLGDKSSKAIQVASVGWAGAGEGAEAA